MPVPVLSDPKSNTNIFTPFDCQDEIYHFRPFLGHGIAMGVLKVPLTLFDENLYPVPIWH